MEKHFYVLCLSVFIFLQTREIQGRLNLAFDVYVPASGKESDLPPIVILHGLFDSKRSWYYIAQPLADKTGRKIYTLDARNHGKSPWTSEFYLDILVQDLEDFLAFHNITKATFVGHSMGGRTAQTLALRQPDKVEMLIVEDMHMSDLTLLPDAFIGMLLRAFRKSVAAIPPGADQETAFEAARARFFKLIPESQIPARSFDEHVTPINIDGGNLTWQANLDVLEDRLYAGALGNNLTGTSETDALFMYGTKSIIQVYNDKTIKDFFPNVEMLGFQGANHLIHHEFPEDYVREIVRFITGKITPGSKC